MLSVVAVQVKSVQDAIRDKKDIFNFMGEMIRCVPTVGIFITMNPGYAGRTELRMSSLIISLIMLFVYKTLQLCRIK